MIKKRNRSQFLRLAVMLFLALVMATIGSPRSAQAGNIYYVALNGNDANPGTQALPWRTIQKAANMLTSGETVVVQAGDYGERVTMSRSGSDGQPLTFRANGSVSMKGFTIQASYVTVDGFHITGTPNESPNGYGVYVLGTHNTVENNYVYYTQRSGIFLYAPFASPQQTSYNVVRNNKVQRVTCAGIETMGEHNLVEGNEIWDTIQYHPLWTTPPSCVDADGMRVHGGFHTVRGNYIHDIHYSDPQNDNPHIDCFQTFSSTNYHEAAHDTVFEKNFCRNLETQASGENGHGFMISGGAANLTIRNNIILAHSMMQAFDSNAIHVMNNTFGSDLSFQYAPLGIVLQNTSNSNVEDNIFIDVGATGAPYIDIRGTTTNTTGGYNLVWMSDGRTPGGSAWPNDLWKVNPQVVNRAAGDYHLIPGSPVIDSGVALAQVSEDYEGHTRPAGAGWDRGAYEAVASAPQGTPTPSGGNVSIENFESYADDAALQAAWTVANNTQLVVTRDGVKKSEGSYGMRFAYSLGALNYAGASRVFSASASWAGENGLAFWLAPDGSGRSLHVQFMEAGGEYWEATYLLSGTASSNVYIPFSQFARPAWYTPDAQANGVQDLGSIAQLAFYVNQDLTAPGSGTIYFDQVQAATGPVAPPPTATLAPTTTPTNVPPTAAPTATSVPTAQPTATQVPTATPTPARTATAQPTATQVPTATPTLSRVATATPAPLISSYLVPVYNSPVTKASGDNNGFEAAADAAYVLDGRFTVDARSGTGSSDLYTSSQKDRHVYGGFPFGLPSGAAVLGIEVRLDAKADSTAGSPRLYVQVSSDGGATWSAAKATSYLGGARATYTLGSSSDTWGHAWSAGQANNLRVLITSVAATPTRQLLSGQGRGAGHVPEIDITWRG